MQPGVNVIGAPDDRRPFLIAADHGLGYVRRLKRNGSVALAGFALCAALSVGLVAARF